MRNRECAMHMQKNLANQIPQHWKIFQTLGLGQELLTQVCDMKASGMQYNIPFPPYLTSFRHHSNNILSDQVILSLVVDTADCNVLIGT